MDYYKQTQSFSHGQGVQAAYVYPTATSAGGAGVYYQHAMGSYGQQPSPYSMQPSVSQGGSGLVNQTGGGNNGRVRSLRPGQDQVMQHSLQHSRTFPQNEDLPLRMVVDSKYVGAIIGQGGGKIREITKETKARCIVDAHKGMRDPHGGSEKVILIHGTPESTSKAVARILEVIEGEKEKEREKEAAAGGDASIDTEMELKLRANNQLVGRLIGKQGATIKKIMQDTLTTISVSNESTNGLGGMNAMHAMYGDLLGGSERTITVRAASIDAISAAEQKITSKLKQAHEYDVLGRSGMGQGSAFPMQAPYPTDPYAFMAVEGLRTSVNSFKNARMFVPNNMVGAIIGSKGTYIRSIMRTTGAHIRIDGNERRGEKKEDGSVEGEKKEDSIENKSIEEKKEIEEGIEDGEKKEEERLVTIGGTDQQIYRAQFAIFSKVGEQNAHLGEEVKLRSEVSVPSRLVGRIIGKGGQNVRELQRVTGAVVKVAEETGASSIENITSSLDASSLDPKEGSSGVPAPSSSIPEGGETTVRIFGNIYATVGAEVRISTLVAEYNRHQNSHSDRSNGASGTTSQEV